MPAPSVEFGPILPELLLVGFAIVLLLGGVMVRRLSPVVLVLVSLAGIAAAAAASLWLWDWDGGATVLAGAVATDRFGVVVRAIVLSVAAIGVVLGHH